MRVAIRTPCLYTTEWCFCNRWTIVEYLNEHLHLYKIPRYVCARTHACATYTHTCTHACLSSLVSRHACSQCGPHALRAVIKDTERYRCRPTPTVHIKRREGGRSRLMFLTNGPSRYENRSASMCVAFQILGHTDTRFVNL